MLGSCLQSTPVAEQLLLNHFSPRLLRAADFLPSAWCCCWHRTACRTLPSSQLTRPWALPCPVLPLNATSPPARAGSSFSGQWRCFYAVLFLYPQVCRSASEVCDDSRCLLPLSLKFYYLSSWENQNFLTFSPPSISICNYRHRVVPAKRHVPATWALSGTGHRHSSWVIGSHEGRTVKCRGQGHKHLDFLSCVVRVALTGQPWGSKEQTTPAQCSYCMQQKHIRLPGCLCWEVQEFLEPPRFPLNWSRCFVCTRSTPIF